MTAEVGRDQVVRSWLQVFVLIIIISVPIGLIATFDAVSDPSSAERLRALAFITGSVTLFFLTTLLSARSALSGDGIGLILTWIREERILSRLMGVLVIMVSLFALSIILGALSSWTGIIAILAISVFLAVRSALKAAWGSWAEEVGVPSRQSRIRKLLHERTGLVSSDMQPRMILPSFQSGLLLYGSATLVSSLVIALSGMASDTAIAPLILPALSIAVLLWSLVYRKRATARSSKS